LERILDDPELFFKAQRLAQEKAFGRYLRRMRRICKVIRNHLKTLIRRFGRAFRESGARPICQSATTL
jgi:hypothetical protein